MSMFLNSFDLLICYSLLILKLAKFNFPYIVNIV